MGRPCFSNVTHYHATELINNFMLVVNVRFGDIGGIVDLPV
jgi:hypothetical protein